MELNMKETFKALVVREQSDGSFQRSIESMQASSLPDGEVTIKVEYSSLNYKDALSSTGNKGVTRKYPHTPGIDAAGIVLSDTSGQFKPGQQVIVTGFDFGMNTHGGFGEYIRVPAGWVIQLPETLSMKESMIYGTAGFTAALSVNKLVNYGIKPEDGPILVTGATGGVGSVAVSILHKLGYSVTALTGKAQAKDMLIKSGAKSIISREELLENAHKALLKEQWAGVIDTVGGNILEAAIKSTKYSGCVTCCGNVASPSLAITVYPFILRGVALLGVDSVECPMQIRTEIWQRLAGQWKPESLDSNSREISLTEVNESIDLILEGRLKGRTVINMNK